MIMLKLFAVGYTSQVGELKEINDMKTLTFRLVTRRDYLSTVTANGKQEKERKADYYTVRVRGALAETLHSFAKDKDENGKTISRFIELNGYMETYTAKREEVKTHTFDLEGEEIEADITHETYVTEHVIIATSIVFLDAPKSSAKTTTVVPVRKKGVGVSVAKPVEDVAAKPEVKAEAVVAIDLGLTGDLDDDDDYPCV